MMDEYLYFSLGKYQHAVDQAMDEVNQSMSPYLESSELSLVNREAAWKVLPISLELYSVIERSLTYSDKTSGAFDITFASVGYLYNYRESIRPDQTQLEAGLDGVNFKHIELNKADKTIHFKRDGVGSRARTGTIPKVPLITYDSHIIAGVARIKAYFDIYSDRLIVPSLGRGGHGIDHFFREN